MSAGAVAARVQFTAAFAQQGVKLVGSPAGGNFVNEGRSVAVSGDGSTILVGAPGLNSFDGGAFVFVRSGSQWIQQGPALSGSDATASAEQGGSVALSRDGNTALVYGGGDNGETGAAWVFTRSGTTWTQDGPKLVVAGSAGPDGLGGKVAVSADGNTAVVGAPGLGSNAGGAAIFIRSGATWTQQGPDLVANCIASCTGPNGTGESGGGEFGSAATLSSDGNTVLIGALDDSGGAGAAWVFVRTGMTWAQQGAKLVGTGAAGAANQGDSVSLSDDGNTALVGAEADNAGVGAAWVFTRAASTWAQQSKLIGNGASGAEFQISGTALSGDGNTALLGSPTDQTSSRGAALVFTRSGSTWAQQPELVGSGAAGGSEQGASVAVSGDSTTAVIGGPADSTNLGAAWVFSSGPPPAVTLTAAVAGTGAGKITAAGISCPGTCSHSYSPGTAVTLTASPESGSAFAGWSGACTGTPTCRLTLTSDAQVTATFTKLPACRLQVSHLVRLPGSGNGRHHRATIPTGAVRVNERCDQVTRGVLGGILTEVTRGSGHHGKRHVSRYHLGRVRSSLLANRPRQIFLKLPSGALAGLRRHARETLSLTLVATAANSTGSAAATVTLRGKT